jgi:hypothetical protein
MDPGDVQAAVQRVLSSATLQGSERRRRLLEYLVLRAGEGIKEQIVGIEVFGREATYNPRTDAVVRVEVGRLRSKLIEYYASEGAEERFRIEIPKGTYKAVFRDTAANSGNPAAIARPRVSLRYVLGTLLLVALVTLGVLWRLVLPIPNRPSRQAEDLYLRGRYLFEKRTPDSLHAAIQIFGEAIHKDSGYAKAYAGLADCYNLLREFAAMPDSEAYPLAREAAQKAVDLDDSLSEAHASLGFALFWGFWNVERGEKEFRRAIDLDPKSARAHHWYATALVVLGRPDAALAEIERARQIEPSSTAILADKGYVLAHAGHVAEAIQLLKELEITEPQLVTTHRFLSWIYLDERKYADYLAEAKQAAALSGDAGALAVVEAAEQAYTAGGEKGLLQGLLDERLRQLREGSGLEYEVATAYARLGESDKALRHLRASWERHEPVLMGVAAEGGLASLKGDPGYRELLGRIGLGKF